MTSPVYGTHDSPGHAPRGLGFANVSYAGAGASAVVAICSFLAWAELGSNGDTKTLKGTDGDGMFTLIAGIVAAALFVGGVFARKAVVSAAAALPALVALVFGVLNLADNERLPAAWAEDEGASSAEAEAFAKSIDVSTQFGLYLVLLGALVAVGAGIAVYLQGRRG